MYGKKLAKKGYIVLVFDHLGYGDSDGPVRNSCLEEWRASEMLSASSARSPSSIERETFWSGRVRKRGLPANLAAVIQEVVDRPDWRVGNAIVIFPDGSEAASDGVSVVSYEGINHRLERAPRLYIERR